MNLLDLFSLQGALFAMMLLGLWLRKRGMIDDRGKQCLNDLCLNVIIPCNIFKSCLIEFDLGILHACGMLLLAAAVMQVLCLVLNRWIFNRYDPRRKKVLQYCTIVPMSGFLGNPVAEGLYDQTGVLYASFFLIPMRVVMWSVGTTYFVADSTVDKKKVLRNVLTHPCLVAIYLGLICMVTQVHVPAVVTKTVQYISACNSAVSMIIVGTILAEVKLTTIVNRDTVLFSILRLGILPAVALGLGLLLRLDPTALGVGVLMTGMPAGATAAIFADRYHSDAPFATRCVVMTTLASMLSLPIWMYVVG